MRFSRSLLLFLSGGAVMFAGTAFGQYIVQPQMVQPSQTQQATATSAVFPDVQTGNSFAPSINSMVRSGVVKGYDNGKFGPNDNVTRGQVTVMIDRYDKKVVQPMREQIAEMRKLLNLGACGDGAVQTGEQCDDRNTADGDGCSSNCQKETATEKPSTCGNGTCDPGEMTLCPTCGIGVTCEGACIQGTCPKDCGEESEEDPTKPTPKPRPPMPGSDRDEHGCIGSAGYSWCAPKEKCLRIWEEECE